ncbi:hypothetical protein SAMN02910293_00150 [Streptococcus henryi]|uniref:DNA repair protein n=1 Tax=Streptococcus henryi TaxID=439219 RepID=A0A1G6A2F1_9STRE|nr:DNA repair protein [Streptococcus henryi]SDB02565.1 hypothetical protein SAMN02910293_00150 [Streptococcus henryi]
MEEKYLRKLRRSDLFELLVSQAEKIESLEAKVSDLEKQLEDKTLLIEKAGSIAEASLQINKIFETAQAAADQYLANIERLASESHSEKVEQ